jgi:predicted dehydrogenase
VPVDASSRPVTVGFLGTGFIATAHSKRLRGISPDLLIRGPVFDLDQNRTAAFARLSGHTPATSADEVIDTCDAVFVTTWTSAHRALVERVVEAGKAVFCEKPLATTLADPIAMTTAVERSGVVGQAGLILRHSPAWALVRNLVNDPAAGRLMSIVFRDDQFIPTQGHYESTWRADVEKVGGGTLLEHSVHDLDLIRWVGGEISDVHCRTAHFHGLVGIEDVATVSMQMTSGAHAVLTSVWHDNLARPSQRHVEFLCERRIVTIAGDDYFGPVSWQDTDGVTHTLENEELTSKGLALLNGQMNSSIAFVEAVAANRPAQPTFRDALEAQRLVHLAYDSASQAIIPSVQ